MKPAISILLFVLALLLPPLTPGAWSQSAKFSILHKFGQPDNNGDEGGNLNSGLIVGKDGNFYGLTTYGGLYGYGTAYKITPGGTFTALQQFGNNNGTAPQGGLLQGSDGNFYGVTGQGGTGNQGTIYRLTPSGQRTLMHAFAGNAMGDTAHPATRLAQGKDGNFYGTAIGDPGYLGAIYQISPTGVFTILHEFTPIFNYKTHYYSPVTVGGDGNLYGAYTERSGNTLFAGYFYRLTPGGAFDKLYSYQTGQPSGLTEVTPGVFYGMSPGSIFKLTADGQYSVVRSGNFTNFEAISYGGGLLLASDGKLYGATGNGAQGMIFSLKPDGSDYTVLYQGFTGADGIDVEMPLVQGRNGSFYGTTLAGGRVNGGDGLIFNLAIFPEITSPATASAKIGQPFSYQIKATLDPTRFGVLGLTPGLHVDAKTGIISGTPTAGAGKRTLTLEATNTGGTGTGTLTLTISN